MMSVLMQGAAILPPKTGAAAGSGDWLVGLIAIVGFAIVVTIAMLLANRPAKVKPTVTEVPEETSFRKAA